MDTEHTASDVMTLGQLEGPMNRLLYGSNGLRAQDLRTQPRRSVRNYLVQAQEACRIGLNPQDFGFTEQVSAEPRLED